jgi:signal transduction histidine kinase
MDNKIEPFMADNTSDSQAIDMAVANEELLRRIDEQQIIEEELERNFYLQNAISSILQISLQPISLSDQLERALELIISIPCFDLLLKGAIFLVEEHDESEQLVMSVNYKLSKRRIEANKVVPFGEKAYGQAVAQRRILFEDGEYSVPILASNSVIGLLNIYTKLDHKGEYEEREFLAMVADALAGIIARKKAEEALHRTKEELEKQSIEMKEKNEELSKYLIKIEDTQEKLVESEKMSGLGQLVAGIAHEINTPIGIGVTAASHFEEITELIKVDFDEGKMKKSDLDHYFSDAKKTSSLILKNLLRTSDLIRSFKMVSADQTSEEHRSFKLKEYIDDIVISLRPKLKKTKYEVVIECSEEIEMRSCPGAVAQIVTNLIMNSLNHGFDGMDEGKMELKIKKDEDQAIVSYHDNGIGMPADNVKKIFEPFYTTKKGKGGTGLGLSIVYNLAKNTLHGSIECFSVPDFGTTFILTMPISLLEHQ